MSPLDINLTTTPTCADASDGEIQVQVAGSQAPYQYQWSHIAEEKKHLQGLSPATYQLTISDAQNCTAIQTIPLRSFQQPTYEIAETAISCFDSADGSIVLVSNDSLQYRLNNAEFTTQFAYENLGPGAYEVSVKDENNCIYNTDIRLVDPPPIELALPEDLTIQLGEVVELRPIVRYPYPLQLEWSSASSLSCTDCISTQLQPFEDTKVELTVFDAQNCEAQEEVFIQVLAGKDVYIPSGFSPNGDGRNDIFTIFSAKLPIEKVEVFRVYDRWGTLLFEATAFQPNQDNYGWDGTYRGQIMDNGVYIYYTKIRFIDGTEAFYEGDVTLVK